MRPLAPSAAAFFRCDLIIPSSEVMSASPWEVSTATSSYSPGTRSAPVKSRTPSGQTAEWLAVEFMTVAPVYTQAEVNETPRMRGTSARMVRLPVAGRVGHSGPDGPATRLQPEVHGWRSSGGKAAGGCWLRPNGAGLPPLARPPWPGERAGGG